jgi:hypothetical protein
MPDLGMSLTFPSNGRPLGPGGSGRMFFLLEYEQTAYSMMSMAKVTERLFDDKNFMINIWQWINDTVVEVFVSIRGV